jgi:hypothetical protein
VPLVLATASFAGGAERLAGAGAGPDGSLVWPPRKPESKGPTTDAGKEMTLTETCQIGRSNIDN